MRTPSYKTVEETHKISVGMKPLSERDENLTGDNWFAGITY